MSHAKEMVTYPVVHGKTACIVVDMQNDFVSEASPLYVKDALAMTGRLATLLDACRAKEIPVIYLRHVLRGDGSDVGRLAEIHAPVAQKKVICAGTPGVEIHPTLRPTPGDIVIEKPRYSGFYGTPLEAVLRTKQIDTLIIAGTTTNVCCESTARDAFSRDYKIIFLSDGTAALDQPDMGWGPVPAAEAQRVVLTVMAVAYGRVATVDEVLAEIEALPRAKAA